MKNSDMPAMPNSVEAIPTSQYESVPINWPHGLTKREHFAGLAMQGLMSADASFQMSSDEVAKESILQADALLNQLGE